ncbi:hypothetical protein FDF74_11485 [Clostridium niameyense]|uniref:Uncharacterized protein n=1 Tax=Clostridium niameyense TaxID=1622073 RepID=A0A6M0RC73_9CLOT|nr:hypothetical protein [Clostridium niameyense]NEZ47803.1 hypothetical protein [Clostridium niameyense]
MRSDLIRKKLICLLHHPLRLTKIRDCDVEDFENENREIRVYKCKYCGKDILVRERCIKIEFDKPFESNIKRVPPSKAKAPSPPPRQF